MLARNAVAAVIGSVTLVIFGTHLGALIATANSLQNFGMPGKDHRLPESDRISMTR